MSVILPTISPSPAITGRPRGSRPARRGNLSSAAIGTIFGVTVAVKLRHIAARRPGGGADTIGHRIARGLKRRAVSAGRRALPAPDRPRGRRLRWPDGTVTSPRPWGSLKVLSSGTGNGPWFGAARCRRRLPADSLRACFRAADVVDQQGEEDPEQPDARGSPDRSCQRMLTM